MNTVSFVTFSVLACALGLALPHAVALDGCPFEDITCVHGTFAPKNCMEYSPRIDSAMPTYTCDCEPGPWIYCAALLPPIRLFPCISSYNDTQSLPLSFFYFLPVLCNCLMGILTLFLFFFFVIRMNQAGTGQTVRSPPRACAGPSDRSLTTLSLETLLISVTLSVLFQVNHS